MFGHISLHTFFWAWRRLNDEAERCLVQHVAPFFNISIRFASKHNSFGILQGLWWDILWYKFECAEIRDTSSLSFMLVWRTMTAKSDFLSNRDCIVLCSLCTHSKWGHSNYALVSRHRWCFFLKHETWHFWSKNDYISSKVCRIGFNMVQLNWAWLKN